MRETTLHIHPETKEERAEFAREGAEMALREMGHKCSNPECEALQAMEKALIEITEMGLLEWRREKASGDIEARETHPLANLLIDIAFDQAAELAQPAVMAAASF